MYIGRAKIIMDVVMVYGSRKGCRELRRDAY